ncbi:MAG: glycosyltransferase, partial [Desulfobulbales bacterium]
GDAEKDIKRIFSDHHLSGRLIMPGILRGSELADCYKAMDLFVFASHSETQGLVLMEAMAAGVPVIALRASGVSDVVEDKVNGRILRTNASKKTFEAAIDDALARRKVDRWRQKALHTAERFSRENCAAGLLELYASAVSEQKTPKGKADMLDTIRKNLKIEWELIQEKTSAMMNSLAEHEKKRKP